MSDSVQPHRGQPTRLLDPWDFPGKNTGAGCHFLLQCMKVKSESEVTHSCPTPRDPMDCSPPGSSIHGIFQARVLEWGAIQPNTGSIPGLGRSHGEGNGNPLQYSCLGNSVDRRAWWVIVHGTAKELGTIYGLKNTNNKYTYIHSFVDSIPLQVIMEY